ncbi:MAG: class I SAM-dependent methyltransferase [Campylobacteraceae bacterium]|nr:class I SAM-dependent methyltransferase [Campylobacteraceae bacterium]
MSQKTPGHTFMKSLGRTRLRPGGGVITNWLIEQAGIKCEDKILEVACNHGDNLIRIYNEYKCDIKAIDLDEEALKECRKNLEILEFDKEIEIFKMDARELEFNDNSFDIVINEAMITLLSPNDKKKVISEYFRVLKPGGVLLTHDIVKVFDDEPKLIEKNLSKAVNLQARPLLRDEWFSLIESFGFRVISFKTGDFGLIDKETIIKDEGPIRAAKFYENAAKDENKEQFNRMLKNTTSGKINYIAIISKKPY